MPNPGLAPNVVQAQAKNIPQLSQVSSGAPMQNMPGQTPQPSSLGPSAPQMGQNDQSIVIKALVDFLKMSQKAQAQPAYEQPSQPVMPMGGGQGGCGYNKGMGGGQMNNYMSYQMPNLNYGRG